ncbi:hypothetical protein [Paraburkholderia sp. BCC1885]|uniref:hypothetical protein n=1 Tax=Paraburkholderia sp. BCC1885 TaxID=2562669 RepID=UPI00118425A0|nr:hypothetical protein [Paraburkholderia sp. BCC1885]
MCKIHNVGYYAEDRANDRDGLDVPSLIIVYGFASWPKDKPDLLDSADLAGISSLHDMRKGNIGLHTYIEKFPKWQALFDNAEVKRKAQGDAGTTQAEAASDGPFSSSNSSSSTSNTFSK